MLLCQRRDRALPSEPFVKAHRCSEDGLKAGLLVLSPQSWNPSLLPL